MLVFHFYEQKGYQTWLVHTSFAEITDEKELGNQNSVEESRFQRVIYTTPSKKSSPETGNLVLFSKLLWREEDNNVSIPSAASPTGIKHRAP